MRVLMLSWEYPPHIVGGLGKHVAELAPALAAEGIEVVVLTPLLRNGQPRERQEPGVEVVRVPLPRMDEYDYTAFVSEANHEFARAAHALQLQVGNFHLIHAHDWLVAEAGIALKHLWRVPLIATIHATERGRGGGALDGWQSHHIDQLEWQLAFESWRIIVCSKFMAGQLAETFSTPSDKISVVPNGINLRPAPFQCDDERHAFRRRFAADGKALALYVGRIVYEKGLHVLLEAWLQVMPRIDACLVIAGVGPYLDELKSKAAALGITQQVLFTGFISDEDRDRLYRVADVAIFPSLYEPFGIVALEAFAAECPVVATSTGGLGEVVHLHDTGILVHPNNAGSLAWGILHTLLRPDWARIRAANALADVRGRYTWSSIAWETVGVYQRVHREWQAGTWGKELAPVRQ